MRKKTATTESGREPQAIQVANGKTKLLAELAKGDITQDAIRAILGGGECGLEAVIRGILQEPDGCARAIDTIPQIVTFLETLLAGKSHHEALKASVLPWMHIQTLIGRYPAFAKLYKLAREAGEEVRQAWREFEADRRAFEGWEEPIYDLKGGLRGTIRRFSDRLAETQLKANGGEKYSERKQVKHEGGGGGISYTFIGVVMGQQTGPEATKAVPATIEMREPRPSAKEIEDGAAHAD